MAAYLIFDVQIHDPEPFGRFMAGVKPLIEAAGARYLARGGAFEVLEGDWQPHRLVLIEFPSLDAARAFVAGPDYAPLRALRQSCSTGNVVILEGLPPT